MESAGLTWDVVPNSVADRLIDFSLTHKLAPSTKLRRRSKVMNSAMKQYHSLKSYSQYVKIKTSVLRHLSDDSETDDDLDLTEDDYNILYKSDSCMSNYLMQVSKRSEDFSEIESEFSKTDQECEEKNEKSPVKRKRKKRKSGNGTNSGWQIVPNGKFKSTLKNNSMKKKNEKFAYNDSMYASSDDSQSETDKRIVVPESNVRVCTSPNKRYDVLVNSEHNLKENMASSSTKGSPCHELTPREVSECYKRPVQSNLMSDKCNKKQQPEDDCFDETSNALSVQTHTEIDDPCETEDANNLLPDPNVSISEDRTNQNEGASQSFMDRSRAVKSVKTEPSVVSNMPQQKDSGIEEDTEDELPEIKSVQCKQNNNNNNNSLQKTEHHSTTESPTVMNHEDPTALHKYQKFHGSDVPMDDAVFIDTLKCSDESRRERESDNEGVQNKELKPKITGTEIVNKIYKVVSCEDLQPDKDAGPMELQDEIMREEGELNDDENVPSLTKRRLQQLKRLNFTEDSDTSLSENEDTCHRSEDTISKTVDQSNECPVRLNSKTGDENNQHEVSSLEDEKLIEVDNEYENGRRTSTCPLNSETYNGEQRLQQINGGPPGSITKVSFPTGKAVKRKSNFDREAIHDDADNQGGGSRAKHPNQGASTRDRPRNLEELLKGEEEDGDRLILETAKPTITLKDIDEDYEIFIMDIPLTVFKSQLVGEKIVLSEKKLKVGNQKYKIEYKEVDTVSCVFASGKSRKPYKTVNIKPAARIVTRRKI